MKKEARLPLREWRDDVSDIMSPLFDPSPATQRKSSSQFTDTSSVISSKTNTIYKSNSNLSELTRRSVSSLSDSSNSSNNTNVSDFYIYDSDTSIESPKVKKNTRLSNLYNIFS